MTKPFYYYCVTVLLLSACAGSPTLVSEKAVTAKIAPGKTIQVIPPKVTYENVKDRSPLDPEKYQGPDVAAKIEATAVSNFQKNNFSVNKIEDAPLAKTANRLFRRKLDEQTRGQLDQTCAEKNNSAVLAHYLRVKVGTSGYWNPSSGAIGPNNSTSYLQAGLFDCETKAVLWRNAVFFRAVPAVSNKTVDEIQGDEDQFNKALSTLYKSISN